MSENLFSGWAIVELMGHVRIAGRVTEEEHFGSKLGRVDIPTDGGEFSLDKLRMTELEVS